MSDCISKKKITSLVVHGTIKAYRRNPYTNTGTYLLEERKFKSVEHRRLIMRQMVATWGGTLAYFHINYGETK